MFAAVGAAQNTCRMIIERFFFSFSKRMILSTRQSFNLNKRKKTILICLIFVIIFFYCEFLIYYVTLLWCRWPAHPHKDGAQKLNVMILADTHMLGPLRGHWFDKLRREWQMHRSFQTAITLFQPEVVFILGDLFDEGDFVNHEQFENYVVRFNKLFHVPEGTRLISLAGNHDVGFHYRLHPYFTKRFEKTFSNTGVSLYTIKDVHFVLINSMAMEDDGCHFCEKAKYDISNISTILNCAETPKTCRGQKPDIVYSQPVILQHFPTYRKSDQVCLEHDSPAIELYRENWEVLSRNSTKYLGQMLKPRVAFSGHSHHFCRLKNRINIEEFTIASFNWRNKNDPSFLLATFTPKSYAVSVCYMPQESIVLNIYIVTMAVFTIWILYVVVIYIRKYISKKIKEKHR